MTLLVAGTEGDHVWMVADTAISDPKGFIYHRPKIKIVQNCSLIGFAGDIIGWEFICKTIKLLPGKDVLEFLRAKTAEYKDALDFAYAYMDENNPVLFKVSNGKISERTRLYLGSQHAYNKFKNIQNSKTPDHAPDSLHTFIFEVHNPDVKPRELANAVHILLRLFPTQHARDVSGWATPFTLHKNGAERGNYYYSVSDPIINNLALRHNYSIWNSPVGWLYHVFFWSKRTRWNNYLLATKAWRNNLDRKRKSNSTI